MWKKFVHISVIISSLLSFFIVIYNYSSIPKGYEYIWLLPVMFFIGYLLFFFKQVNGTSNPIVLYGILGMEYIRFILIPIFCTLAGENNGMFYINPSPQSLRLSIFFMIIELFAVGVFFNLVTTNNSIVKFSEAKKQYYLAGNKIIYYIFFIFSGIIFFLFGRNRNLVNFLFIETSGDGVRNGDLEGIGDLMIRQFIVCSIFLFFCIVVNYSKKKIEETNNNIYFYLSLFAGLLNLSMLTGERRSNQVYVAFCTILILLKCFPKFKKKILVIMISMVSFILILMSIYKFFYVFLYDSYIEAVKESSINIEFISQTLQSYFFGPQNIAITIDFFNDTSFSIFQSLFDFFRSIFGLSFLFKGSEEITSVYFNTYVYGFQQSNGHVLSGVGYSYGFYGIYFIYAQSIFNVWISVIIENLLKRETKIEYLYVYSYILIRFVTNLFVNTAPLISQSTIFAFSSFAVIFLAQLFNTRKGKGDKIEAI
ncbi:hypothetical protein [Vagococcus fluvialis]|uniref:hypothetical protein n=1 Tax=Vagococcus fluvialis TaxID=2738 RepID=UPI003B5B6BE1